MVLRVTSNVEAGLHVLQSLHESMFMSMRSEFGILRRQRVELIHVHQAIIGQNGLHPNAANVVQARSHEHVGDRAFRHVLARLAPRNVGNRSGMCHVHKSVIQLHWIAEKAAHRLVVL